MADLPPSKTPTRRKRKTSSAGLVELRQLLFGPEQGRLQDLEEQLEDTPLQARRTSRVLPQAIRLRGEKDAELLQALRPTVEEVIQISVEENPGALVRALYPVIGPAIRRAISNALSGMILAFNRGLEQAFTARGLKWRLEAMRTGKTYAEVALLHSLYYRVEQVFLIQRSSGLLLAHVVAEEITADDPDLVSSMLRALEDFVGDSFQVAQTSQLQTLKVGDLTVCVEQGPEAILAAAVRGTVPQDLRTLLQTTIEQIHRDFAQELEEFDGDDLAFEGARTLLQECLQFEFKEEKKSVPWLGWGLATAVVVLVLIGVGILYRDSKRWDQYLERLKGEPGIIVTESRAGWGSFSVAGLRDPLAVDPAGVLDESPLDADQVQGLWKPYFSSEPEFVLQRAIEILKPPQSGQLFLEQGRLSFNGIASLDWIREARRLAPTILGGSELQLVNSDLQKLEGWRSAIERERFSFDSGSVRLQDQQVSQLEAFSKDILNFLELAGRMDQDLYLEVRGHPDTQGSPSLNLQLAERRAAYIRNELIQKGIAPGRLSAFGDYGSPFGVDPSLWRRSVSFQLAYRPKLETK